LNNTVPINQTIVLSLSDVMVRNVKVM